jgi:hypothetical protein
MNEPRGTKKWLEDNFPADEITDEIAASNPLKVEDYEPHFDRSGNVRRVLGSITDEVDAHAGGVPRNTRDAVGRYLVNDDVVPGITDQEQVDDAFDSLIDHGLVEQNDDGSYSLTTEGWIELSN